MKTLLLPAFALLLIGCSKNGSEYGGQGTHWDAGESLEIMNGNFQACAGRFGNSQSDGTTTFTRYRVSVERAQEVGGWRVLFEKDFPLKEIPEEIRMHDGSDVAQFNSKNNIVTFDLGSQQIEYEIKPNKSEMATPRKLSD